MSNEEIINAMLAKKKGSYVSLKKIKDLGNGVTKITDMVIRLGIEYANMKVNEGKEIGSLPWGHWVEGLEGYVIEHKGNYYLRVTEGMTKENTTKSVYMLGGQEVSRESVENLIPASKLKTSESVVYNIKFENIIQLG